MSSLLTFFMLVAVMSFAICLPLVIFGRIADRAGYSRWWALTMLVPGLNVLVMWIFAFAIWPVMTPGGRA